MKRLVLSALVAATALMFLVQPAEAKLREAKHTGFYVSLGVGLGSLGLDFDNVDFNFDRETGGAADLRIGWTLSQKVLLGLESNVWSKKVENLGDDGKVTFSNAAASLTYYLNDYFFVKGGPAIGSVKVEANRGSLKLSETKSGPGFTAGVGAEFRLATKFAIVPTAQWNYQKTDNIKSNFVSLTVGVGWFW